MSDSANTNLAIFGGGPAGLMAAQSAAEAGAKVTLYEAKRSVGRKFLVAGKSGLNLTNATDKESFLTHYRSQTTSPNTWKNILEDWNNHNTREWANSLGIETFVSSGNKVFPVNLKAAPLLRRWIEHLRSLGVEFKVNHKLKNIIPNNKVELAFSTPSETKEYSHDHVILALGGASWPNTGSDGKWINMLSGLGIETKPLVAANCGWHVEWPTALLEESEGLPIKNTVFSSLSHCLEGEVVITKYGLEGGPIYKLGPELRESHILYVDFKPTFNKEQLLKKMESAKTNLLAEAKSRLKLPLSVISILKHYHHADTLTKYELIDKIKSCAIQCTSPRPIDEAISCAGGVSFEGLDSQLRIISYPNISIAGEMLDWEAPTGGFLLQGCFATARRTTSIFQKKQ